MLPSFSSGSNEKPKEAARAILGHMMDMDMDLKEVSELPGRVSHRKLMCPIHAPYLPDSSFGLYCGYRPTSCLTAATMSTSQLAK